MKLNDNDYKEIASRIEEGTGTIEYEKDGEMLQIDYTYEVDGYYEDDYYNGTGAFVETERSLSVNDAMVFDGDGVKIPFELDGRKLEREIA